jgi:hypothetical protein
MGEQTASGKPVETSLELTVEIPPLTSSSELTAEEKDDLGFYLWLVRENLSFLKVEGMKAAVPSNEKEDVKTIDQVEEDKPKVSKYEGTYLYTYASRDFYELINKFGTNLYPVDFLQIFNEAVQYVISISSEIYQDIATQKAALDILTDFATIIGATIPIAGAILKVLYLDKKHHKSDKISSVIISIGDVSVTVTDEDLEDAKNAATEVAKRLLKEHPDARLSDKVRIEGKLINPPAQSAPPVTPKAKQTLVHTPRKSRKKRSK